jgi:serine/threonine protein kinase
MMQQAERRDPFELVGKTLAGKYRVETVAEETEMSVVYRASHVIWRRPVAIKAFKAPLVSEAARSSMLAAFVREGALLSELSERTSAVCQARDLSSLVTEQGDWVPYMVLEWLDGIPLDVQLAREHAGRVPARSLESSLRMLEPVARALALAHERGIVHRDVKPGNICVLDDGSGPTKLYDFGIATLFRRLPPSGVVDPVNWSFTPSYGAPEQFSSEYGEVGPWTDVFALALVLVELVTGREALQGQALAELAVRACDPHRRPTPRALGVELGDAVESVLKRALAVRPEARYESVGQLWTAITGASSEPLFDATIAIPLTRRRQPKRHRRLLSLFALGSAGAAAAIVIAHHWSQLTGALLGLL